MKVSGFTFIRNGTLMGYCYIESIRSLLPVCDEVVVAVGDSDDDTLERIQGIGDPRVRIIRTTWNENMRVSGYTYAQQKMIAQFNCTGDWAFYLEGDEVIHERDHDTIRGAMERYHDDHEVEALVFDYYHIWGSPQTRFYSPRWYRRAPRIIRNTIRSYAADGLFWVVLTENKRGRYPRAAAVGSHIYHYGHVRSVARMNEKIQRVERYWDKNPAPFPGYGDVDPQAIIPFDDTHPAIMEDWLEHEAEQRFVPNPDYRLTRRDIKHRIIARAERWLGGRDFVKKHYRLIRP